MSNWLHNTIFGNILGLFSAGILSFGSISLFYNTLGLTTFGEITFYNFINSTALCGIFLFCWVFIDIYLLICNNLDLIKHKLGDKND